MIKEVRRDISRCEEIIQAEDVLEAKKHGDTIIYIYESYISGIRSGLDKYAIEVLHKKRNADFIADIKLLKRKLEVFAANGCTPTDKLKDKNNGSVININNNNMLDINVSVDVKIQSVLESIDENIYMSDTEKEETKEIVAELGTIDKSNDSKNKKWEKIKPILKWLSTRGLDISLQLIPIIQQILIQN